jgi:UDP-N-acetyl-D-galactosamine dehydrogenase
MSEAKREKIGIVGLGYVGLPLAVAFARAFDVIGYDISAERVEELRGGTDGTGEVDSKALQQSSLELASDIEALADCTFIVITVPTPLNLAREPDLTAVRESSKSVGGILKRGMAVIYESTVYPGVTEEICLPILEKESGLKLGDFDLGYSPERVNPGDKTHTVATIMKVVSGHDDAALNRIADTYGAVIEAGIHRAPNIMTAEAAKVIENVQRDLNIALMNELSLIFSRLGINTHEVLAAAGTKWNFHPYHPGLVGGHCIGVDPYYLTYRALQLGYHPEVILAGRRINDYMGNYVGDLTIRALNAAGRLPSEANVWILGMTFKENVPDFRNTRAVDVVQYLTGFECTVTAWEPLVGPESIKLHFGLDTQTFDEVEGIDAVVLINGHDAFKTITLDKLKAKMRTPVLVDVKNFFSGSEAEALGFHYVGL